MPTSRLSASPKYQSGFFEMILSPSQNEMTVFPAPNPTGSPRARPCHSLGMRAGGGGGGGGGGHQPLREIGAEREGGKEGRVSRRSALNQCGRGRGRLRRTDGRGQEGERGKDGVGILIYYGRDWLMVENADPARGMLPKQVSCRGPIGLRG